MYIPKPVISNVPNFSAMTSSLPLEKNSRLSFDMSGVLGLAGGDEALSAMVAVHVYGNRRMLGWYNNPGSFQLYEQFRSLAKSVTLPSNASTKPHVTESIHVNPMKLLGLAATKGPKYQAAQSGTVIEDTGYLASIFLKECISGDSVGKVVAGRKTQPVGITIVDIGPAPPTEIRPAQASFITLLSASIPIGVSVSACAVSAIFEDWYAASLILVGIAASGVFSLVLGSADLVFTHPEPAKGSPAGDGMLSSDKDIVLVRGTEGAVNAITRGTLSLRFSSAGHYYLARACSFLFLVQAVSQLLLIGSASLFGQIMFLASLGVSALYNAWVCASDKEGIHRRLLFQQILDRPTVTKYSLGTRTSAVVFVLLVLRPQNPSGLLDALLPNDTKVWRQWKATILESLCRSDDPSSFEFGSHTTDVDGWTQEEKGLLQVLYQDARAAYDGYRDCLGADSL